MYIFGISGIDIYLDQNFRQLSLRVKILLKNCVFIENVRKMDFLKLLGKQLQKISFQYVHVLCLCAKKQAQETSISIKSNVIENDVVYQKYQFSFKMSEKTFLS